MYLYSEYSNLLVVGVYLIQSLKEESFKILELALLKGGGLTEVSQLTHLSEFRVQLETFSVKVNVPPQQKTPWRLAQGEWGHLWLQS